MRGAWLFFLALSACLSHAAALDERLASLPANLPSVQVGGMLNNSSLQDIYQGASGIRQAVAGGASSIMPDLALPPPPSMEIPAAQVRLIAAAVAVLFYVFAAGKIADFLQNSGRPVSRKEALYAPFAYAFLGVLAVLLYFSSPVSRPPQDTLVTNLFYLVLAPAMIAIAAGTLALHSFFHDRMGFHQSLDLSIRIILAPVFDGMRGYWTALGAAAVLTVISGVAFYSSGGMLASATFDFLLLSIVASLYFIYRALTCVGNEQRASNAVTVLAILAPSVLQHFFRDAVCAALSLIPIKFFETCPLYRVGSEVSLALSVGATMLLLLPVIPIIYALAVNLLRALTLARLLMRKEARKAKEE